MENVPYGEASRRSKVDFLALFSNSTDIRPTSRPTHGRVDEMGFFKVLTYVSAQIRIRFCLFSSICLLELQAGHTGHDLLVSRGDVFNLIIQEYWFHNAVPFKGLNPVWYVAPWPEFCLFSEESIESLSSPEMSLRYGDVSFNQTGAGLGRNEIPPKVCRESPRCGKKPQEANESHVHPSLKREKGVLLPLLMGKLVWVARRVVYW